MQSRGKSHTDILYRMVFRYKTKSNSRSLPSSIDDRIKNNVLSLSLRL